MPINFREGQRGHVSMLRYLLGAPIVNQADRAAKAIEQKENSAIIATLRANSTTSAVSPGRFLKNFSPDEVDDNRSDLSRRVTLTQRRRDIIKKRKRNQSTCAAQTTCRLLSSTRGDQRSRERSQMSPLISNQKHKVQLTIEEAEEKETVNDAKDTTSHLGSDDNRSIIRNHLKSPSSPIKLASAIKVKIGSGAGGALTKVSMPSSRSAVTWHSNFTKSKIASSITGGP